MIFSIKTLIISAILFASSLMIIGIMYLPVFHGVNGFKTMETTFNSLRKGVRPPFKKIELTNEQYLGKNFRTTLVFRDSDKARIATMMFLANKLTVTPKGSSVNIQGDLGYTLKFFMEDIYLLYENRFDILEKKYSMPFMQSMYMLDRILKKLATSMASQKMKPQEKLIQDIRSRLLVPSYNLREALPVGQTSGFFYLAIGTLGIMLFAILWDISNYMFFGTLASENFLKPLRISLGRELSDDEKAAIKRKNELMEIKRKKLEAAKRARAEKKAEELMKVREGGTRTNKETLKKKPKQSKDAASAAKRELTSEEKQAKLKALQAKKRAAAKAQKQAAQQKVNKSASASDKKAVTSPKPATGRKTTEAGKQAAQSATGNKKQKGHPIKKQARTEQADKPQTGRKPAPAKDKQQPKKGAAEASQTATKKVTTRKGEKTAKAAPTGKRKVASKSQTQGNKTVSEQQKAKAKAQDKS